MYMKTICAVAIALLVAPAAFCWEVNWTFDAETHWKYFDTTEQGTTGAVDISSATGVLLVPYPQDTFRFAFVDKDATNPAFPPNVALGGGYVEATLSYTGVAPTFAYFFLAGAGDPGDDIVYGTDISQTYYSTAWTNPLHLTTSPQTFKIDFGESFWHLDSIGNSGSASWAQTISSVDAVGIAFGYYGVENISGSTVNVGEFTVTPEPSLLLLSGPLAGFLGWRIRKRGKRPAATA